jgi:hypothetical protein
MSAIKLENISRWISFVNLYSIFAFLGKKEVERKTSSFSSNKTATAATNSILATCTTLEASKWVQGCLPDGV